MMEPLLLLWLWDIAVVAGRLVVGGSAAAVYVYNNCTTVFVHSPSDGNNWSTYVLVYLIYLYLETSICHGDCIALLCVWRCLYICVKI